MKYIWDSDWFFVPVAMFFGFCGVLALMVPYSQELLFFNDFRQEPLNTIFLFFTQCGEVWAFVVFGLALLYRKPRFTLILAIVGLLAIPLGYFIKDAAGIDRPFTYFEKRSALTTVTLVPEAAITRGQTSFPSGHTLAAFALYSLLALMAGRRFERWGLPLAFLAILVGVSRIFLMQHFLVDILGGAFLGLLLSQTVWYISGKIWR